MEDARDAEKDDPPLVIARRALRFLLKLHHDHGGDSPPEGPHIGSTERAVLLQQLEKLRDLMRRERKTGHFGNTYVLDLIDTAEHSEAIDNEGYLPYSVIHHVAGWVREALESLLEEFAVERIDEARLPSGRVTVRLPDGS